jgi:hypothetical protein
VTFAKAKLGSFRKSVFWRRCDIPKGDGGFVSQIAIESELGRPFVGPFSAITHRYTDGYDTRYVATLWGPYQAGMAQTLFNDVISMTRSIAVGPGRSSHRER